MPAIDVAALVLPLIVFPAVVAIGQIRSGHLADALPRFRRADVDARSFGERPEEEETVLRSVWKYSGVANGRVRGVGGADSPSLPSIGKIDGQDEEEEKKRRREQHENAFSHLIFPLRIRTRGET